MAKGPSAAVAAAAAKSARAPSEDVLSGVRAKVRELRDLQMESGSLSERQSEISTRANELQHRELVDAFNGAGITSLGIEAEGNLPPYYMQLRPYYRAVLPKDPGKRGAGLAWLDKNEPDLIKTVFVVALGMRDRAKAKKVRAALRKLRAEFDEKTDVPHQTLTAFIKDQFENRGTPLPPSVLENLGATVGQVVKPAKEKK